MALDEAIAIHVRNGEAPPTIRLYGWSGPSVSLGSFQKITDINLQYCIDNNIPVVRRPTGGRGILHGDELTYSFSAKNAGEFSTGLLETYRKLSAAFQSALNKAGLNVTMKMERESGRSLMRSPLCFQSTSYGEISFSDKKLIGSAQKRWSDGFLQQGSIPYFIDHEKLKEVFKIGKSPQPPFSKGGEGGINNENEMVGLRELIADFNPEKFKEHTKSAFEETFRITLVDSKPSPQEHEIALLLLSEKYQNPRWTRGAVKDILSCDNNEILKKALQG